MRLILVFLIAFGAGFAARPWLISNVAPNLPHEATSWINSFFVGEEPVEPKTFGFIGYLTEDGFHGSSGDLSVGEGPDQIFDLCDPVDIQVTLAPKEGSVIFFGGATIVEDAEFNATIAVGPRDVGAVSRGRAVVSLGSWSDLRADATDSGLFLNSGNNTTDAVGGSGDAFGYFELVNELNFLSETHGAVGLSTYDEVAAFFNSVNAVSGELDFRYCDESLIGEACPARTDFALPLRTILEFTESCSLG